MPDSHLDESRFWQGIRLFNQQEFFVAHEVLEDLWREAAPADRAFLQGLIQIAAALHHHVRGNRAGAESLLARGEQNLSGYAEGGGGLDLRRLRNEIALWREALAQRQTPPWWPQMVPLGAKIVAPVNYSASPECGPQLRVPMLDLRRQYARIREQASAAMERVCAAQSLILGEEVAAFERDAAAFLGVQTAVGCASGTDALWLALVAAGVNPGDSVITTPFSFLASAILETSARTASTEPGAVRQAFTTCSAARAA